MSSVEFLALCIALMFVLGSIAIAVLFQLLRDEWELYKLRRERKADKKHGPR